jgi:hypothetical protein
LTYLQSSTLSPYFNTMPVPNGHSAPKTNGHSNGVSAAVPIVDPTAMKRPVDSVRVESDQTSYTVSRSRASNDVIGAYPDTF